MQVTALSEAMEVDRTQHRSSSSLIERFKLCGLRLPNGGGMAQSCAREALRRAVAIAVCVSLALLSWTMLLPEASAACTIQPSFIGTNAYGKYTAGSLMQVKYTKSGGCSGQTQYILL